MKSSPEPSQPLPQSIAAIDAAALQVQSDAPGLNAWVEGYVRYHRRRLAIDIDLLERFAPGAERTLEIGSAPPVLTLALKNLGRPVVGLDIAPDRFATTTAKHGLDIRTCDIERDPIPAEDGAFDVVLMNEVFEHLRINLLFTMSEVRRVLKPGGVLLMSTPNLRSLRGFYNFLWHGLGYSCAANPYDEYSKLEKLGHMGHVREYTPREVREFLQHMGLKVEHQVFRGAEPGAAGVLLSLAAGLRPFVSYVAR